jgi:hypothetical protein
LDAIHIILLLKKDEKGYVFYGSAMGVCRFRGKCNCGSMGIPRWACMAMFGIGAVFYGVFVIKNK